MARKFNHSLWDKAKSNKKDEFYTQLIDIERELSNYKKHFYGKTVFCNCDDIKNSNFFKYFVKNFKTLGLKKLICACYKDSTLFSSEQGYYYEYIGTDTIEPDMDKIIPFKGDGDFRSSESIEL